MAVTTTASTSLSLPVHLQPPPTFHHRRRTCRLLPPLVPSRNSSVQASPSPSPTPSSTSTVEDPAPDPPEDNTSGPQLSAENKEGLQLRGCKACGRVEIEKGCNGEGRIQGGIATVPGFGWWPIKAYRPCPGFVESGGRYRRQGQSMDEVAFGRGKRETSLQSRNEGETK